MVNGEWLMVNKVVEPKSATQRKLNSFAEARSKNSVFTPDCNYYIQISAKISIQNKKWIVQV